MLFLYYFVMSIFLAQMYELHSDQNTGQLSFRERERERGKRKKEQKGKREREIVCVILCMSVGVV